MPYVFRGMAVPDRVLESLHQYVDHGVPLGGFLEAVVDNDLSEACGRADEDNITVLPAIVAWLYNQAPTEAWGFAGAHKRWVKKQLEKNKQESWWRVQ